MTTKWSIADFEILRVVGVGYSGKVMAVSEKKTAKIFAIKVIRKCRSKGKRYLQQSVHERNIMARIAAINYRDQDIPIDGEGCRCLLEWGTGNSCPFLIKMYSAFQDEKNLFFVMDYHRSGDLGDLLDVHLRFSEDHARLFAAEIVLGISQLHACNIIHRDMKPSNILISDRGDIVLSDFGLGRLFSTSSPLLEYSSNDAVCVLLEKRIADSFCGTPEYIAPEIICRCPYDEGVDWWSFGTVLYEMLVGVTPFWNENCTVMYSNIVGETEPEFPSCIGEDAKDLILGLLRKDSARRFGEKQIKCHPFFSTIDWDRLRKRGYEMPYHSYVAHLDKDLEGISLTEPILSVNLSSSSHHLNDFSLGFK